MTQDSPGYVDSIHIDENLSKRSVDPGSQDVHSCGVRHGEYKRHKIKWLMPLSTVALAVLIAGCGTGAGSNTASSASLAGSNPSSLSTQITSQQPSSTSMSSQPSNSGPSPATSNKPTALPSPTPTHSTAVPAVKPPHIPGVTWHHTGAKSAAGTQLIEVARVHGGSIGLMWMDAPALNFRYVPGYQYPENSPQRAKDHKPSTWVHNMVAAINGGFHLSDDVGGYFYDGQLVKRLRSGLASVNISTNGRVSVGVWDRTIASTTGYEAIRQNLPPLVWHGRPQAYPSDSNSAWGQANGGLAQANRSALGELKDGTVIFAYGYNVQAYELADALANAGVKTAVMLDMNKSWPTGFYYEQRGSGLPAGHRILPEIVRDPSTYFQQFKKDFFVVELPAGQ